MNFHLARIDVQIDTCDADDGRISKNIIHQYPKPMANGTEMTSLWKRIDFGHESLKIDIEKPFFAFPKRFLINLGIAQSDSGNSMWGRRKAAETPD